MAEAFPMILQLIHLTLRRAVARRDVRALRNLLLSEGGPAFAAALQCCSARVRADALSLLPLGERPAVIRHLPPALRRASGIGASHSSQCSSPGPLGMRLRARLIASSTVASI